MMSKVYDIRILNLNVIEILNILIMNDFLRLSGRFWRLRTSKEWGRNKNVTNRSKKVFESWSEIFTRSNCENQLMNYGTINKNLLRPLSSKWHWCCLGVNSKLQIRDRWWPSWWKWSWCRSDSRDDSDLICLKQQTKLWCSCRGWSQEGVCL